MKRITALLLCVIMLLTLASCAADGGGASDDKGKAFVSGGKTTLMIYMIGSDLEAKTGAGTEDLEEIVKSGVDLSLNDVVIYTGGSPAWHNEIVNEEQSFVISLGEKGFKNEKAFDSASMGEAATLKSFLNYCAEQHPAEHYALILWDHGSGPVIGYGKDMLYDNDTLTLAEMKEALSGSPFNEENKIEWIGFDACLMASAELCCTMSPYANYLIASQEIEPAFGWNYAFLKDSGKVETKELMSGVTEGYLKACLDYFEKKDYHDRDSTLACVDLTCAGELEDSLNALFAAAEGDIDKKYDSIAARRVNTRALGRASTGSEYDLIDLMSLAQQMESDYPAEAGALQAAVEKMTVCNSTNAQGLCGISLYYPFYNKDYYEDTWSDTYKDLNAFTSYLSFLSKYEKKWLGSEMEDEYEPPEEPEEKDSTFTLKLSDEQAGHYASAKYYILEKEGKETFTKIYSSADVEYDGESTLTANFDGNVIYAHNNVDEYLLPVVMEHDTVGGITNYSTRISLNNAQGGSLADEILRDGSDEANKKLRYQLCRFVIAADKEEGNISLSSIMPYYSEDDLTGIQSGKYEELDISDYTNYMFYQESHRTLTRKENGLVDAVDNWIDKGVVSANWWSIGDGLDFVYAPLAYGEYSLVFEITDTQNNVYCSEPVDIDTSGLEWLEDKTAKEPTRVESDGNFPLLLKEDETLALYLDKYVRETDDWWKDEVERYEYLTFYIENKSDMKLDVHGVDDIICNEDIYCSDATGPNGEIEPGAKSQLYLETFDLYSVIEDEELRKQLQENHKEHPSEFYFGAAFESGANKKMSKLQFDITVSDFDDNKTIWKDETIIIDFKKGKEYEPWQKGGENLVYLDKERGDLYGAKTDKQTIADNKEFKVELLGLETDDSGKIIGVAQITNKKDDWLYIATDALSVDGIYLNVNSQSKIPPAKRTYQSFFIGSMDLESFGLTGAQQVRLALRTAENDMYLWQGYGKTLWADVKLSEKSKSPSKLTPGTQTLMDENGVVIKLKECQVNDNGYINWIMTLENKNDEGVMVNFIDLTIDGKKYSELNSPVYMVDTKVGPKQITLLELHKSYGTKDIKEAELRFVVYDENGEKVLFKAKNKTKMKPQ